jgi:hypothetical protein
MHACVIILMILIKDMPNFYDHSLSTRILLLCCVIAIIGSDLGIIFNHDDNNNDATPILSMFMLFVLLTTRSYILIRIWRTTQENSATTILYGSDLD